MMLIGAVRLEAASVARQLRARWRASLILSALLWVAILGWWLPAGLALVMALLYDRTRRAIFREFGRYQLEVGQLAALIVVYVLAIRFLGGDLGLAATILLAGAPFAHPATRERLLARYWLEGRRREWRDACAWHGLYRPGTRQQHERPAPRLLSAHRTPVGLSLRVRCSAGWTAADVERAAPGLASWYRARNVQVAPDARDVATLTVLIAERDPLAKLAGTPWPSLGEARLSLWQPIPVGVDEAGAPVTLHLPERNLLVSGEPGAGKSVAVNMIVATGALDPDVDLFMLDGKGGIELTRWQPSCQAFAASDHGQALGVLKAAQRWLDASLARLLSEERLTVEPGERLALVVIDELAWYLDGPKSKTEPMLSLLRDLVQRGRAAGVIVVAATQRPASDVIPTSFRDLVAYRWGLRCVTPQASDMALGTGWAAQGYDASTIAADQGGTGYLRAEGAHPIKCRTYMVGNTESLQLSKRAATLRQNTGNLPLPVSRPTGPEGNGRGITEPEGLPWDSRAESPPEPGGNAMRPAPGSRWREQVLKELAIDPDRSNSQIARKLGCDRNTVRKYRAEAGL